MVDKPESIVETERKSGEPAEAAPDKEPQPGPDGPEHGEDEKIGAGSDEKSTSRVEDSSESGSDHVPKSGDGPAGGETKEAASADGDTTLAESRRELADLEDRFLRQAADFQNFRKRALEERALSIDIGRTQIALPMVDVLDDLRRSLKAVEEADPTEPGTFEALRNGVKLVYEKFESELARIGIKPMDAVGKPFDEERHEALLQQPAPPGTKPGTVLVEVQKGYMIGDRVLRHARVVVAT